MTTHARSRGIPGRARLLAPLAAVAIAAAVAGCGGGSSSSTTSAAAPATTASTPATTMTTTPTATSTTPASTMTSTTPSSTMTTTTPSTTSTAPAAGGGGGDATAGRAVFTTNCASCHTLADAGSSGNVGPNLDNLRPNDALVTRQVTNGGGGMPAFAGQLSRSDIANVARYVSSVAGRRTSTRSSGGAATP